MFAHVGVIRRRLKRDIEGNLQALCRRCCNERVEVHNRTQARFDGGVAAAFRANRPRTPRIVGRCRQGVVGAFTEAVPDGMNRWEIEHIESHRRHVRQQRSRLGKRGAPCRVRSRGARKHFVPRTKPCALPLDRHREDSVVPRSLTSIRSRGHEGGDVLAQRRADAGSEIATALQHSDGCDAFVRCRSG